MKINIPDAQVVEMEALDNAFWGWINSSQEDIDEVEFWIEKWNSIDKDTLSFTENEMHDAYDPVEDYNSAYLAMERDMADRIRYKRSLINTINETG